MSVPPNKTGPAGGPAGGVPPNKTGFAGGPAGGAPPNKTGFAGGFAGGPGGAGLRAEGLSAGYPGRGVLRDLNLELGEGELLVLAGPNGSGKTTLLKTLAGLIKPLSGRVLLRGRDAAALSSREKAAQRAFLFQENGPRWPFTVEELVSQGFYYKRGGSPAASGPAGLLKQALEETGLTDFADRPVTELSGGEYQRVLIARALVQGAPFLLLDEPANNLDPKYQLLVMDLLRGLVKKGRSVLVSLHDLNLAALYGDRIALLSKGSLAALAPPAEALRRDLLEAVFGVPFGIQGHPEAPALPQVYPPAPGLG